MKAKNSIVLLTGLLLVMFIAGWTQSAEPTVRTCPASDYDINREPRVRYMRAVLNVNAKQWEMDCKYLSMPANAANAANWATAPANAITNSPRGRRTRNANRPSSNTNDLFNTNAVPAVNVVARPATNTRP